MKIKSTFFIVMLLITAFLSGCNSATSNETKKIDQGKNHNESVTVYTTIFTLEDFTKKIGGKHVDVKTIYPTGVDAHTYEPTMRTMMDIADADLFIYNGAGLEPFVDKAKDSLSNNKVTMVEAIKGIEILSGHEHDHHDDEDGHDLESEHDHENEDEHNHEGEHDHVDEDGHEDEGEHNHEDNNQEEHHHHHDQDPHVWLDPIYAITMAENIKNALSDILPSAKDDFENNFNDLKQKLEQLDLDFQTVIDSADNKEILVSHASYGYWEHRYDLKQISISGLNPQNEPSQKQLKNIIEIVKEHDINYIVYDQTPIVKVADIVKNETGATAVTLHNIENITADNIKNKDDYFSIMNQNVKVLKEILAK